MRRQATLWLLDLGTIGDAALAVGLESLGASVQQRHRRFRRPERQRQFLAGRLLLRQALSTVGGVDASQIAFIERPGAAPRLCMPGTPPFFSISHAGSWVACAVSQCAPLGLDVEVHARQRDFAALAAHSFDAAIAARIAALPEAQRAPAFYREWCMLEAAYKLGRRPLHWLHPRHAELTIAIASIEPLELVVRVA